MNSTELLGTFREEMNDLQTPYLWSDALLYRYINDAQEMFCRRTEGIACTQNNTGFLLHQRKGKLRGRGCLPGSIDSYKANHLWVMGPYVQSSFGTC